MVFILLFWLLSVGYVNVNGRYFAGNQNCSILTNANVSFIQMLDGKTAIGGYVMYFANGTLLDYDTEGKLIGMGTFEFMQGPNNDLCYEKE